MRTATGTLMITDSALYRLMSWLSPGYPVGAYSYSHGLEHAVVAGTVGDRAALVDWIDAVLLLGTGRIDGALFRAAWQAWHGPDVRRIDEIAELGRAMQPSAEIAAESASQGDAFLVATGAAWPAELRAPEDGPVVYPVAVGLACAAHGIGLEPGLAAYFHAVAANLVSAGVRLIPLGQTDGQRALAALEPSVVSACRAAMTAELDALGTATPAIDLASIHHETQYSRLFRS